MSRIQSAGARGPAFGACGLALGAYAAHKGRAVAARRGEHLEQARDVARIVLAVAVHGGDDGACRRQDAGAHRRALAAAVIMPQVVQAGAVAPFDEGLYLGSGGIRAGVVDDDPSASREGGMVAYVSSTSLPMLPASFNAGITTVTRIKCPYPTGKPRPHLLNGSAAHRLPVFTTVFQPSK